ncbi:MAG: type secretory pathway, component PulF [Bacteroidetes bacterium]|nr:type secretory pathway, component PulF [Bacteroidota bacterium]
MEIELKAIKKPAAAVKREKRSGWMDALNRDISFTSVGLTDKKKERFYSEMHILFSAGVDIRTALELVEEGQLKEKDKQLYAGIKEAVISGQSFSNALEKTGRFSVYEFYSLKIGEESGKLPEVLQELAVFFSKKIKQKRLLTKALSYPVIVLLSSVGAIAFMLKFVVPMFADVFKRFKGGLPYFTQLIIRFSDAFSHYFIWLLLISVLFCVFVYSQRQQPWFRKFSSGLLLRIPVVKELVSKIYLARFCQSMQLLIASKTPLVSAIDLVKKMIGFYPIEISLETVKEDVMKGKSLHESLSQFSIYNKRLVSLIKVAEEVNQLDKMFTRLANQYSDEVEHQTSVLGSLIEPLMILFLGAIITVILIAMYLPMFQMSNSIG